MSTSYPIVGMKFRPPAQGILNVLPAGAKLLARREPSNAYDANAIQVLWCTDPALVETSKLDLSVEGYGSSAASVLAQNEWHLGYIPRTEALVLAPKMDAAGKTMLEARLTFSASGLAMCTLEEPA